MEAIKYYLSNNHTDSIGSLFVENSIITITDALGRIEYANDNFCKIIECDSNKLIGESHKLFKSRLHTKELYKNLWRTIKMGQKWNGILSDISSNGKSFWLDTTIIPIKNEVENSIKYLAIYTDITKKQLQHIDLLEHKTEQDNFLKNLPQHVFSITKHGRVLNINKGYRNLKIIDIVGTYIYDYLNPTSFEIFKKNIDSVFINKAPIQFTSFDFDEKGEKYFYTSVVSPVFNEIGVVNSAIISIQENTKRDKASEVLIESEAKYRTIYQSINVGIIVVADKKGHITEWNKGAELAFGYSKLEILGHPLTSLISLKFRKSNIKTLLKAIKKIKINQKTDIVEMCCLHKNGTEFPVEFALSSSNIDDDGFYCAMMLDITKRKSLENKLKQKTKDLELFLYHSAHDLKAPLSSAEGLLNLLKEEDANQRIMFLTDMLDTTIKRGQDLADNLNKVALISNKKNQSKKVDFNKIITKVLKNLSCEKNFDLFEFNIEVLNSYNYKSNPELIGAIFQNLVENAIKYSKVPNKVFTPIIDISVKSEQNNIIIKVCDNGQGISENCTKKIFDLYYKTNTLQTPGNGLGLYIVKNIVEDLNGKINVKSVKDKGSCFEIELPNS